MDFLNSQVELHIKRYFTNRPDILEIWEFIKSQPEFTSEVLEDIDKTISLFNKYRHGDLVEDIPLPSSSYLRKILKEDLPYVTQLIELIKKQDKQTMQLIIDYIEEFDFIETLRPIENCAGTLILGCYRCAVRAIFPYIKEKDGQVASSLEEMAAIMAMKGQKTKLFDTLRTWYKNYEEEGFSRELSEAVKDL